MGGWGHFSWALKVIHKEPGRTASTRCLSTGFSTAGLAGPRLHDVLSTRKIASLPPISTHGRALIRLFAHRVARQKRTVTQSETGIQPSSGKVTFLSRRSRPDPEHNDSPPRQLTNGDPHGSSPSSSPDQQETNGKDNLSSDVIHPAQQAMRKPDDPTSQSEAPAPRSQDHSAAPGIRDPVTVLRQAIPHCSSAPRSTAVGLRSQLRFVTDTGHFAGTGRIVYGAPSGPPSPPNVRAEPGCLETTLK